MSAAVTYAAPGALWLLAVPLALAVLWAWQAVRRWRDARAATGRAHGAVA